jgi:hypothetical protein
MGRYDALTQLEEKPETRTPAPGVVSIHPKKQSKRTGGKFIEKDKMSTNPQTVKPTSQSPTTEHLEKPEKYTTHLEPSLVKRLKLFAVEKDLKDYQVIKNALIHYFEKYK